MDIFIVAGEHSGDQLGFKLMRALRAAAPGPIVFSGVGGPAMVAEGLKSLFDMSDIAVMGALPVLRRLPLLLRRIRETADAAVKARPDVLVLIDSPDFTHRVARRVRRHAPDLAVVDYVSPTVWAWRPGRAAAMAPIIDHVMALLPFEPAAHRRLNGPACSYVGHPLIERLAEFRPNPTEAARRQAAPPRLLLLPGSRRSEIERLLPTFRQAIDRLRDKAPPFELIIPAVPHLADMIAEKTRDWSAAPNIVLGEAAKLQAFRTARAALAKSGTGTLELALAGVPMVVAYKVAAAEYLLRFLVTAPSIVLPNLILGESAIPEFVQRHCTPDALAQALAPLLADTPARGAQLESLAKLDALMRLGRDETPSKRAAAIVLAAARKADRDQRLPIGT